MYMSRYEFVQNKLNLYHNISNLSHDITDFSYTQKFLTSHLFRSDICCRRLQDKSVCYGQVHFRMCLACDLLRINCLASAGTMNGYNTFQYKSMVSKVYFTERMVGWLG